MGKRRRPRLHERPHSEHSEQVGKKVLFAVLNERAIVHQAVDAREDIAAHCAAMGFGRIRNDYARVDVARNRIAKKFLENTKDPKDTLVMLDTDHAHPLDVVARLARHDLGVVGALCFRRTEPFDPQFYVRQENGDLLQPMEWDPSGLERGTIVGTGAIAIQRWVFEKTTYPWFRMMYEDGSDNFYGEDWYFALECEKAGIPHFCDFSVQSPHLTVTAIDERTWASYLQSHPGVVA